MKRPTTPTAPLVDVTNGRLSSAWAAYFTQLGSWLNETTAAIESALGQLEAQAAMVRDGQPSIDLAAHDLMAALSRDSQSSVAAAMDAHAVAAAFSRDADPFQPRRPING